MMNLKNVAHVARARIELIIVSGYVTVSGLG